MAVKRIKNDGNFLDCSHEYGVNFINVKRTNFLYKRHFGSFNYVHVTRKKLSKQRLYEKFVCLKLMKLTDGNL